MKKLIMFGLLLSGCSFISSTFEQTCPDPPAEYLRAPLDRCISKGSSPCCIYPYDRGDPALMCAFLVCHNAACDPWDHIENVCIEIVPPVKKREV